MFTDLIDRFLPNAVIIKTLLIPILAIAILAALSAARLKRNGMRTPYTRKVFHFLVFSAAGILQYYYGLGAVSLLGGIVFLIVIAALIAGERWWFYKALARETDAPHQKKFILLPLLATAAGGIASNLLFPHTAYLGYFVGGWGDAVGEPVGTKWGKHRYKVPTLFGVRATRSIEGSAAVMLVSAIIASVCIYNDPVFNTTVAVSLLYGLLCGIAAAVIEAVSSHGLDNLTMQLCAAGVAHWLIGCCA